MKTKKLAPIHPGEILREEFMKPRGLSQNALGRALGVPPRRVWSMGLSIGLLAVTSLLGDGVRLSFKPNPDRVCELWRSAGLVNWSRVEMLASTNQTLIWEERFDASPMALFRVQTRLEAYELLASRIFPDADIADLRSRFTAATWRETVLSVLDRRFPDASAIVRRLSNRDNFDFWFGGQTNDWNFVMQSLSAAVHESVHIVGFEVFSLAQFSYPMTGEVLLPVDRFETFPRAEILNALPPSLQDLSYNNYYLTGGSGGQGLVTLLGELNAYTFSLLTDFAVLDQFSVSSARSSRDGLLAMMLYTELYLAIARTQHPDAYDRILKTPKSADLILTLWNRALRTLTVSGTDSRLELGDAARLRPHVFASSNLEEIERVRRQVVPLLQMQIVRSTSP